ncbi:uncharacterized protein LOC106713967 [Papilio machaon]|uniref:uncharacterized protein LOC106713967 n=1 Tax=Papilio machaon TaxID=76193 RepID=UPI001E6642EB|nr:uncharacterized protein LOC106713967 [Papilio machaon]
MSKRVYYPQQQGERKRAKLDVTRSDNHLPLSQNNGRNKDDNQDNWGDEGDDEILLLASQACEQAYTDVDNSLPDYTICMKPSSTSTQNFDPGPSTSTYLDLFKKPINNYTSDPFKKPNALNFTSPNIKNKSNLISSPLPNISRSVQNTNPNIIEDMIFNDKVHKGDTNFIYRQLLQLQEENSKLKSENGKLLEKCMTKEGEVSILRTHLKTSQTAADNARLEKIKVQERVQMEWTDKLAAANNQLQDLKTQLDFKNLEITSIKEKCKMLESSKVKLTQVNIPKHDISLSHRNSMYGVRDSTSSTQLARVKTSCKNIQTECRTLTNIVELNITYRKDEKKLTRLLPLTVESTTDQYTLLEYNEKLQKPSDNLNNRCKVFSTFHRIPNTPSPRADVRCKVTLNDVYKDLSFIAADEGSDEVEQKILNIIQAAKIILQDTEVTLNTLELRMTTAFQKEIDEKYIDSSANFLIVSEEDLISGKLLYKEEQGITARRITSVLYHILEDSRAAELFNREDVDVSIHQGNPLLEIIQRICIVLDKTSCAVLFSGFLQSVIKLLYRIFIKTNKNITNRIFKVIKTVIQSRPMLFVTCESLRLLRKVSSTESTDILCKGNSSGNLKLDYDQGVLLYKKDSCFLQVLLKQIEAALKCIEKQKLKEEAVSLCTDLLLFYSDLNMLHESQEKLSCECRQTMLQVIVFALRICAVLLSGDQSEIDTRLLSLCRAGLLVLQRCAARDEVCQLAHCEGHLLHFCHLMLAHPHDELHSNMLSEVMSSLQSSPEESPPSYHTEPWLNSFHTFSLAD